MFGIIVSHTCPRDIDVWGDYQGAGDSSFGAAAVPVPALGRSEFIARPVKVGRDFASDIDSVRDRHIAGPLLEVVELIRKRGANGFIQSRDLLAVCAENIWAIPRIDRGCDMRGAAAVMTTNEDHLRPTISTSTATDLPCNIHHQLCGLDPLDVLG